MSMQQNEAENSAKRTDTPLEFDFLHYPIDISSFLTLSHCAFDAEGIPLLKDTEIYHPTIIAQYALVHWSDWLTDTSNEYHRKLFLRLALWLVNNEMDIDEDAGGWPIVLSFARTPTASSCLSALTQGLGISVLVRAYQLTHEESFRKAAQRAVSTFGKDILDGGVNAPLGEDGVFFEEIGIYPAARTLSGFIFALFGLYDYVKLTGDASIDTLIVRALTTLHSLLGEFDLGSWTRPDLLERRLSSLSQLMLQAALLDALARYTDCEYCKTLASRWKQYPSRLGSRLRYLLSRGQVREAIGRSIRRVLFSRRQSDSSITSVCVPLTAFPVTGGTRAVLAGIAQVMADTWQIEYVTQDIGAGADAYVIHRFGTTKMHPWQFPAVWLYVLAGFLKLTWLMRHGANYRILLPQDGVFTAAFAGLAGKLAGCRIVCIDHGNLTLVKSHSYRAERLAALKTKHWSGPRYLLARLQYVAYWPSLYLLARIASRYVDHFMVPGIAGDGVEESCRDLGISTSHLTRFASMIDSERYTILSPAARAKMRQQAGIATDASVIAMICRLAPEKGIDIATEAINRALSLLPPERQAQVRIVVAGDGPLRSQLEDDLRNRGISQYFILWGETSTQDVIKLLGLSNIFLYTSTRGACISMAILEAMASGCAIVASSLPMSNVRMLAEERGIIVPPGDAQETGNALALLLNDTALCRQMGERAREYVIIHHGAETFRRVLLRMTGWSALDELLYSRTQLLP